MRYDGLGNRLEMTAYNEGVGETIRYQLDNGQPLAAVGAKSTSFYLYGRGVIGTKTDNWGYVLQDGLGSTRQLATHEGMIVMSVAYTPWGDVLEYYGSGGGDFGYLGGMYDDTTGLIYLGGGQYYDPVTGRMLTRGTGQSNPYKPGAFDPAGMMVAPLALIGLVLGKKKKRGKWDTFIAVLVVGIVVTMSVSACDGGGTSPINTTPTANSNTQTAEQIYTSAAKTIAVEDTEETETPVPSGPPVPTPTLDPGCGGMRIGDLANPTDIYAFGGVTGLGISETGMKVGYADEEVLKANPDAPPATDQYHLTAWFAKNATPGYKVIPIQYLGYRGLEVSENSDIGKAGTAQIAIEQSENTPCVVLLGYSAGNHSALFVAEQRLAKGGLGSKLVLLGPPGNQADSVETIAYDLSLNKMTGSDFVKRVKLLAQSGVPVFIYDDTKSFSQLNNVANIEYRQYQGWGHLYLDDDPTVVTEVLKWLGE
ncbi:MAG: hypothetical protein RBT34_15235 [Anaerolineaceae bacterium]|nr:hypothetical protein [Anaerolineaceae bacterium]